VENREPRGGRRRHNSPVTQRVAAIDPERLDGGKARSRFLIEEAPVDGLLELASIDTPVAVCIDSVKDLSQGEKSLEWRKTGMNGG
jgi:hypothetical protein